MPSKQARRNRRVKRFKSQNQAKIIAEQESHKFLFQLVESMFYPKRNAELERGVRHFGKITARFTTVAIDDVPFLNPGSIHVDLESRRNGHCRSFLLTLIRFTLSCTHI